MQPFGQKAQTEKKIIIMHEDWWGVMQKGESCLTHLVLWLRHSAPRCQLPWWKLWSLQPPLLSRLLAEGLCLKLCRHSGLWLKGMKTSVKKIFSKAKGKREPAVYSSVSKKDHSRGTDSTCKWRWYFSQPIQNKCRLLRKILTQRLRASREHLTTFQWLQTVDCRLWLTTGWCKFRLHKKNKHVNGKSKDFSQRRESASHIYRN